MFAMNEKFRTQMSLTTFNQYEKLRITIDILCEDWSRKQVL